MKKDDALLRDDLLTQIKVAIIRLDLSIKSTRGFSRVFKYFPSIPETTGNLLRQAADNGSVAMQKLSELRTAVEGGATISDDARMEIETTCQFHLDEMRDIQDDVLSSFPATQEFLRSKGFSHMRDLDREGRRELEGYLLKVLASVSGR